MSKVSVLKKLPLDTIDLPLPKGGPWDLPRAQAFCIDMALREPQNSQLAYWYLGKHLRPHIAALYAFQRTLLDFAALPGHEALLDAWEAATIDAFRGHAEHPVLVALRATMEDYQLAATPFKTLITGARMAATQKRFTSFQSLLTYVENIGTPLGRVVLSLARDTDIDHTRAADDISIAMTLASFWTHLDVDFRSGRLHIPEEDLLRFGVSESDLTQRRLSPAFRALMEFEISRTKMYLMRGRPLCSHLPESLQTELQMVWFGVNVSLDNILADNCDVFTRSHALRSTDWMRASARLAAWRLKEFVQW